MKKKKEILDNWFEKVWVNEKESIIREMFVPIDKDDKSYGLISQEGMDPEAYLNFHRTILKLINIKSFKIITSAEKDNILHTECLMKFSNRKLDDEKIFTLEGCVIAKIINGKIISADNYFDFMQFFSQLGQLPSDTVDRCLNGENLVWN